MLKLAYKYHGNAVVLKLVQHPGPGFADRYNACVTSSIFKHGVGSDQMSIFIGKRLMLTAHGFSVPRKLDIQALYAGATFGSYAAAIATMARLRECVVAFNTSRGVPTNDADVPNGFMLLP